MKKRGSPKKPKVPEGIPLVPVHGPKLGKKLIDILVPSPPKAPKPPSPPRVPEGPLYAPKPPRGAGWRMAKSLGATGKDGLLGEVNASAPDRSKEDDGGIGDAAHSARTSDHNPCSCHGVVCARDFTHDPKGGFDCEEFCGWLRKRVATGKEPRIKYVIWRRRIFSGMGQRYPAGEWRLYSGINPHTAHCHVSVQHPERLFDNGDSWGWLDYAT